MSSPGVLGMDHIASARLFSPPTTNTSAEAKCTEASGASGASSKGVNAESCVNPSESESLTTLGDQTRVVPSACATASLPFAPGATARSTAAGFPAIGAITATPAGASAPAARSSATIFAARAVGATSTANTPSP